MSITSQKPNNPYLSQLQHEETFYTASVCLNLHCSLSLYCTVTDDIVAQIAPGTFPLRTHEMHVSILTREERLRIYDEVVTQFNLNQQKLDDPFLYQDLDDKSKPASTGICWQYHLFHFVEFGVACIDARCRGLAS